MSGVHPVATRAITRLCGLPLVGTPIAKLLAKAAVRMLRYAREHDPDRYSVIVPAIGIVASCPTETEAQAEAARFAAHMGPIDSRWADAFTPQVHERWIGP